MQFWLRLSHWGKRTKLHVACHAKCYQSAPEQDTKWLNAVADLQLLLGAADVARHLRPATMRTFLLDSALFNL